MYPQVSRTLDPFLMKYYQEDNLNQRCEVIVLRKSKNKTTDVFEVRYDRVLPLKEAIEDIRELARNHVKPRKSSMPSWIFTKIKRGWRELKKNYLELLKTPEGFEELVPSVKWITDNFYILSREIKEIREQVRKRHHMKLPMVEYNGKELYPRVFVLVKEIMEKAGCHFEEGRLKVLLETYQNLSPLSIAELWILPVILKMCYIEMIGVVAVRTLQTVRTKYLAVEKMDQIFNEADPKDAIASKTIDMIKASDRSSDYDFLSHVIYKLRERGINDSSLLDSIIQDGAGMDSGFIQVIREETGLQSDRVSKAAVLVSGMNKVVDLDWREMFQDICVVDEILKSEGCGVYGGMDFDTKNRYRGKIEKAARISGQEEFYIARKVLDMTEGKQKKKAHVGYYLIGDGENDLYKELDIKEGFFRCLGRIIKKFRNPIYFIALFSLSLILTAAAFYYTYTTSSDQRLVLSIFISLNVLIIALNYSGDLINSIFIRFLSRKQPPAMNFEKGIPADCSTAVVVPVLIAGKKSVDKYIDKLEETYLANRGANIYFVILADHADSRNRENEDEKEIDLYAEEKIAGLNRKHATAGNLLFFYLCRYRKWNEKENVWMGWERKRGKIEEFNRLLMGSEETSFTDNRNISQIAGKIKYVITIDSDTELVGGSANKLVGVMAHILNTPEIGADKNRVIKGYALIQPRIDVRLDSFLRSPFTKMLSGKVGIDPYSYASSDIYQDLFREGTFVGKGIYDLEFFSRVLDGRIPENAVLSHDLLEGSFARSGLSSDIQLADGHPANALSFYKREHRWTRGDWQLLPWILGRNKLSLLSRWKMLSNLIRSLLPISGLLYLVTVPLLLEWNTVIYLAAVIFTLAMGLLPDFSRGVITNAFKIGLSYSLIAFMRSIVKDAFRIIYMLSILPFRAYISVDAIIRTLFRLMISGKNLLNWETAEASERKITGKLSDYLYRMYQNLLWGTLCICAGSFLSVSILMVLGILFLSGPFISYALGIPCRYRRKMLKQRDRNELFDVARKTWRFFEEFFDVEYNYLVPDNFQILDEEITATRTSPTNIGLQLMAFLSARDFGFISLNSFVDMVSKTLNTIRRLKKWHGNLYNWYDVTNLEPLHPHYVSSVDSGNFLAYLITLRQGLLDLMEKPVFSLNNLKGIKDVMSETGFDKIDFESLDPERIMDFIKDAIYEIDDQSNSWINRNYSSFARRALMGYLTDLESCDAIDRSLSELCAENNKNARILKDEIDRIMVKLNNLIRNTRLNQLYDFRKNLFHIGYNVTSHEADDSYYDLLASEARTTGFVAMALNQIPRKHWYRLGRPMALVRGLPVLLSWNGTMFEYYMPHLTMHPLKGTIYDFTLRGIVKAQKRYARKKKVPFGISESAYYRFDKNLNYQYRAFGIPALGFKSDLKKFLVISPYSSIMSIEQDPEGVIGNLKKIRLEGGYGRFGFFDAIDYITPSASKLKRPRVIRTFMCHHQGMILVSLDNFLHNNLHRERFHRDASIRAIRFILEETKLLGRVVRENIYTRTPEKRELGDEEYKRARTIRDTHLNYPVTHVMSNDRYQIMIDSEGAGFSKYRNRFLNFWEKDWTNNSYGNYIYIKNATSGTYYSSTYKPTLVEPQTYEVNFYPEKAEYIRVDEGIESRMEIVGLTKMNGEIRRVTLSNKSHEKQKLELTSYVDIILDERSSFSAHPAFSKLFIETEYDHHFRCITATRRQRDLDDPPLYFGATCIQEASQSAVFEYDTDRSRFIGRGRSLEMPAAMESSFHLAGVTGEVVEPCIAMRTYLELAPNEQKTVSFIYLVSENKEDIGPAFHGFRRTESIQDVFSRALFDSRLEMNYLNLDYDKVNAILDASACIFYLLDVLRADKDMIKNNVLSQGDLWKFGISGDNPVILVAIDSIGEIATVKDSVVIYEYLRRNQVVVDLVILNQKREGYQQELSHAIGDVLSNVRAFESDSGSHGIFEINKTDLSDKEHLLLLTTADIYLTGRDRILGTRIRDSRRALDLIEHDSTETDMAKISFPELGLSKNGLRFYNGYGGFDTDKDEYVIISENGRATPMPWINVLANRNFGCLVSESGLGYSYYGNSRGNQLTKWVNEPVIDDLPEAVYLHDELTGEVFTISPGPSGKDSDHIVRHGYGYTTYEAAGRGMLMSQTVFVPVEGNFKYVVVSVENKTKHSRIINAGYFAELVLGESREKSIKYIITDSDDEKGILFACNRFNQLYKDHMAYVFCDSGMNDHTCDKNEFMGSVKNRKTPPGMSKDKLTQNKGATVNPCFALKTSKTVGPDGRISFVFMLGQEKCREKVYETIERYGSYSLAAVEMDKIKSFWKEKLSVVKVTTADEKMNIMLNGWLLYQTIACRIMARTAYYQAGGAFGFRDQLQDCMGLFYSMPEVAREMIINAAAHQFSEGDVMHWWHPDSQTGIRTRISDDLLWLPYVLCRYINVTGDKGILEEQVPFLAWEPLKSDEKERYGKPEVSDETAALYEHAKRAMLHSMKFGAHGLPLMGTGDWNDGMNRVGHEGRGESVWLGWFMYDTFRMFRQTCVPGDDRDFARKLETAAGSLKKALEENAWDGEWYLRAFFRSEERRVGKECRSRWSPYH